MKTVHYVKKEDAKFFLDQLRDQMEKVNPEPLSVDGMITAIEGGKMNLLIALNNKRVMGAMVVQDRKTEHGLTAFIFAIFGRDIASIDYYKEAAKLLKGIGFRYIQGFGRPSVLKMYQRAGLPFKEEQKTERGVFFGAKL